MAYSNCYADGSPIDVAAVSTETSDTSYIFATGLTTNYNNEMVITVCSTGNDPSADKTNTFSLWANGNLASINERMDNDVNEGGGGGFGLADGTLIANGAVGTWSGTLANASAKSYIAFALRSTTPNNLFDQIYGTFGFTNTSETITKVEVGYEAYSSVAEKLNFYESTNGGSSWSSAHQTANLGTSDPGSYTYIDVTSDFSWTWTLLNDTNFKIKVESVWVSGTPTWYIDALVVRVTYNSLTNEQIRVAVSWDGGSSWSSNYDTNLNDSENTYWTDVTSVTSWTPTNLNDSNFRVSVSSVTVGDTSTVNLDWLPVEVTYTIPVISISVDVANYDYGTMAMNSTASSTVIIATNNGGDTENFDILGSDAATTSPYMWELSTSTTGIDIYMHAYTTDSTEPSGTATGTDPAVGWAPLDKDGTYNTLATGVSQGNTVQFYLDMRTPATAGALTTYDTSYDTTVTVRASAP